eukprot:INCI17654.2.p1 GENE.INCI17654.2~~INCI17654.2.p1  ORF type:complete len:678 (+),score=126.78 INCI17654.2:288-2036(+)
MTHQSGAKGTMGAAPPFNDQPASRRRLDQRGQDITSNADAAAYTPAPANGVVAAISDTAATAAIDSNAAKLGGAKAQSDPGDARAKSETEAAGSRDVLVEQECAKSPRLEAGGAHQKNENSPPPTSPRPGSSGSTKRPKASVPQPYEVNSVVTALFRDGTLRETVVLERDIIHKPPGYTKKTCTEVDVRKFRYYVHYNDFNRRMDEWVPFSNFRLPDGSLPPLNDDGSPMPVESTRLGASGVDGLPDNKRVRIKKKDDTVGEFIEELMTPAMDAEALKEHDQLTKVKNVGELEIGRYRIDTWYFSPYPKEVIPDGFLPTLYLCEFCLDFFQFQEDMRYHTQRCRSGRHPPGDEIYRHDGVAFFEIDGTKCKTYCQNLCYMAKLFLDHKTLYSDVDPFLFYVMCEYDNRGYHITGYFSKEKYSEMGYNLACILTLPCYQRRGYGSLLIQFSYELSKKERRVGSPEKPLSDLGQLSYNSYWGTKIVELLQRNFDKKFSVIDIAIATAINAEDVVHTLKLLGILKYSQGSHILHLDQAVIERYTQPKPGRKLIDPTKLHWYPTRESRVADEFSFDVLAAKEQALP